MKMSADEKVKVFCDDAGIAVGTGTMFLTATMVWIYNSFHNLSEMITNLVK